MKLRPCTQAERDFATDHHDLIYKFLSMKRLSEDYYDVVVFGFLAAVQRYLDSADLRASFPFEAIAVNLMKTALRDHRVHMGRQKRSADIVSLDEARTESGASLDNLLPDHRIDFTVATSQCMIENIAPYLNQTQQKCLQLRLRGYEAKDISRMTDLATSTIYSNFTKMRYRIPAHCVI